MLPVARQNTLHQHLATRTGFLHAARMNPEHSTDDAHWLRQAIELSRQHSLGGDGGPFGAVIVRQGRVLAEGWNAVTSTFDPTAHAEVVAIRSACTALRDYRVTGSVLYASCEPCPMCLAAAWWARIERIVFAATREDAAAVGFDDARLYRELAAPIGQRELPLVQLLREEAVPVMQQWHTMPGRIAY
jgi:tRNA(Arg) A34 adenosine deaminase TadA